MTPIEFPQQTDVLNKPPNMTEEECSSLPVFRDGVHCISCWQLTNEEMIQLIQNDGKIYLGVMAGWSQPPVFLSVAPPFV